LTDSDTNSKFVSILADTAIQTTPSTNMRKIRYLWLQQYSDDGDTWQAPYASKEVLVSNADANVTMYNQGRKLVLDGNDSLHNVFRTNQGSLQYSKKADGVTGWSSSLLRGTGDMPALSADYLNRIYVVDRDFVGTNPKYDVLLCQTRAAGGSWDTFQVYSSLLSTGGSIHKIGPPAIVACLSDTGGQGRSAAYIVFTVYEPQPASGKSTTVMLKVSTTGVVYAETLCTVQGKGDSFPSIGAHPTAGLGYGLHVALQSSGEVYVKKTTNQDQPQFTTKRFWSSSYNLSNTASNSRHPIVASDDTILAAWVEGDSGRILTRGQAPGSDYNSWGDTVNVSKCPDSVCDYPNIASGDSNIVTWQKKLSSTNYDIMARVNFHTTINLSNTTSKSTYPHCLFHFHDGAPVVSAVWTEEYGPNYAGVGYKRWQLGEEGGGGTQSTSIFDPGIKPQLFTPSPNPFSHNTSIRFQTNVKGLTRVSVMDITGRRVRNLLCIPQNPGIYTLTWNARDDRERQLPRGVYFVRLQTPNYAESKKLILTE